MRLLLVHNFYKKTNIGGEDVVFSEEKSALINEYGSENVFTYEVCNEDINYFTLIFKIIRNQKCCNDISRIVKENSIDIVHVHNFFPLLSAAIFKSAKKAGAKTVLTLHSYRIWCLSGLLFRTNYGICLECIKSKSYLPGIRYKCYRNSRLQSLVAGIAYIIYKQLNYFNFIDKYFVLTEFQKNIVQDFGIDNNKIEMKPNWVDSVLSSKKTNNKRGFCFVGRLDDFKGIKLLVDCWIKEKLEEDLYIIGNGPLYNYIDSVKNKYIHLMGTMERKNVLDLIKRSRFLIQASLLWETFGLTIIEAFSVGTPVIGFNIGTRIELIKNGQNGFICSPDELIETIKIASEFREYHKLSINALSSAKSYKRKEVLKMQKKSYEKLLRD